MKTKKNIKGTKKTLTKKMKSSLAKVKGLKTVDLNDDFLGLMVDKFYTKTTRKYNKNVVQFVMDVKKELAKLAE